MRRGQRGDELQGVAGDGTCKGCAAGSENGYPRDLDTGVTMGFGALDAR